MRKLSPFLLLPFFLFFTGCNRETALTKNKPIALNPQQSPGIQFQDDRRQTDELNQTIEAGIQNLMDLKQSDQRGDYWALPGYLGSHYVSQYYLFSKWLGSEISDRQKRELLELILSTQNKEKGFWLALEDANLKEPNAIDPSIYHYWALKVMKKEFPGEAPRIEAALKKAKTYIRSQGGIEKSVLFTKIILALFDNYSWDKIPYVPSLTYAQLLSKFTVNEFSQWVIPHLKPIGYIRAFRVKKQLGPEFSVQELLLQSGEGTEVSNPISLGSLLAQCEKIIKTTDWSENLDRQQWKSLVESQIIPLQKPRGSWGGYTLSTIFSLISIEHYQKEFGLHSFTTEEIQNRRQRALQFLTGLYFDTGLSSFKGVLDDGSYWDTALILRALNENGVAKEKLQGVGQFLANLQQKNGAFPFGYDFEDYSDVDDTVETMLGMDGLDVKNYDAKQALRFVYDFQNRDSGWGTFDKNNTGNFLLKMFTTDFKDSAELFDISRPDVTGHALEVLGKYGYTVRNSSNIYRAINYLQQSRDKNTKASWLGRWGVNQIFGTSAVVTGLKEVGLDQKHPLMTDAVAWLKSIQNSDGGFGETTESYRDTKYLRPDFNISTASQTAWALMALVDAGEVNSESAQKAVRFLIHQFKENKNNLISSYIPSQAKGGPLATAYDEIQKRGFWSDPSVTGTGHPKLIYMVYPSYPYSWPLIALAKYKKAKANNL